MLTNKKLGIVVCACHPSYIGSINKRIAVQVSLCIMQDLTGKIPK
jgi:hypothetical protein